MEGLVPERSWRFLKFAEDVRPPYNGNLLAFTLGTWTKTSAKVKARKPFSQDEEILDYDFDSEGIHICRFIF